MDETAFFAAAADVLDVPPEALSFETAYASIPQWDSVQHIRLVMELSARFNVEIPLEKIPDLTTLGAFFTWMTERSNGSGA